MPTNDNYNSVMQLLGRKRQDINKSSLLDANSLETVIQQDIKNTPFIASSSNEFIQLNNEEFNYNLLEESLSRELRKKELALKNIFSNAYTQIGAILKEAQLLLASHNKKIGIFEAWYTSLGLKKDSVYRLISRFDLLANCEKKERDLLETIPLSLAYEISKPSCSENLKKAVFRGEIKTLKDFQDKKKLLSLNEEKEYILKKVTKKDFQKKRARLLNSFAIFQKKSSLPSDDPTLIFSLISYLNKADQALKSLNNLLE